MNENTPLHAMPTPNTINTLKTIEHNRVSAEEREALIRRLVADNLGLVRLEARRAVLRYAAGLDRETGLDLYEECFQEGVLGLRRAAELFDGAKGTKFSTYAHFWIFKKANEAARTWAEDLGHLSLDMPAGEDDDATLGSFVADEASPDPSDATERRLRAGFARDLLAALPARDRAMVEMYFGFLGDGPATFADVGAAFAVSTQRAARIVDRALRRLRAAAAAA